jgi:hypothetical protein
MKCTLTVYLINRREIRMHTKLCKENTNKYMNEINIQYHR